MLRRRTPSFSPTWLWIGCAAPDAPAVFAQDGAAPGGFHGQPALVVSNDKIELTVPPLGEDMVA